MHLNINLFRFISNTLILVRILLQLVLFIVPYVLLGQLPREYFQTSKQVTKFDEYDGSMYIYNKAKPAIVYKGDIESQEAKLKYNIYTDAFEHKDKSHTYTVIKSSTIQITLDHEDFYYRDFKTKKQLNQSGYFVQLDKKKHYGLYKKYTIEITKPKSSYVMSEAPTPGKLKTIISYYLEENDIILELPINTKKFLSLLNTKSKEVKEYMKKEKLKLKREEDLIKILSYYATIQPQNLLDNMVQSK